MKTDREIAESAISANMRSTTDRILADAEFREVFTPGKIIEMLDDLDELRRMGPSADVLQRNIRLAEEVQRLNTELRKLKRIQGR